MYFCTINCLYMISKIILPENVNKVEKLLDKYDNIVIVTHTSPDGDAIGSSLGLYHLLMDIEKDVRVVVNNQIPANLLWMKGAKDIIINQDTPDYAAEVIAGAELIFCLDFNTPRRMGEQVESYVMDSSAKRVLIDHHPSPQHFTDVIISHPEISSTSELVFRLICRMEYYDRISFEGAEALYTGMMTDTGNFSYNSNNSEIYYIIAELLRKGIDKDRIYSRVNGSHREERIRLLGYVLCEKMKTYKSHSASLITLTYEEMARFDHKPGETDGFVNIPLDIEGITFSAFFREENSRIKVSLRSKGDLDVNVICREYFNGGGHRNAAGGELFCSMDEAVVLFEKVIASLR